MATTQEQPRFKEEWITAEDGHEVFTKTWYAVGAPVASIVFVHGLGEHIVRKSTLLRGITRPKSLETVIPTQQL